ncbi:MAG: bifunctional diaminohydroxyphosphoribosylaminopyrimidine deaminase/5-amino-6-(5-phosphoribosylamino)uracil reductase RibD, partial [Alphaproteobacteria bacterium]|nr:bifunctional diaminohydroxyphosphoribosylaminopyrimidine deaminase/5-amino-6-(5-phosphoribosylamino)uracil reductase RibD [Alphaproteobacteria bacterium]
AYVTLEPCSHHGQTPPCAGALVAAGIARVVAPIADPDPRVAGAGFAALRAAGVEVVDGVEAAAAAELNLGFLTHRRLGRPAVTLKLATTLDGRIATASGESRWITGPSARDFGHLLRAEHDAVMVGAETARLDDPELTCRLPGLEERSPIRVIADTGARLPPDSVLARSAREVPVLVLAGGSARPEARQTLEAAGVRVLSVAEGADGHIDLAAGLRALGGEGITRLLVEGGGRLAASLLSAGLVDRLVHIRAGAVMGADGRPAIGPLGLARLAELHRFHRLSVRPLGPDSVETFQAVPAAAGASK